MTNKIKEWIADKDMKIINDVINIKISDERSHVVNINETDEHLIAVGKIASRSKVESNVDIEWIWHRNRHAMFVSYCLDKAGCLIGEIWIPKIGLEKDEFQLLVRILAQECDRLEYLITGKDCE